MLVRSKQRTMHFLYRMAQGAALGAGAPLGWLAIRFVLGLDASHPDYDFWLFLYISAGSIFVFSGVGLWMAREELRLERLSLVDPLTGLYNRRQFESVLASEFARWQRRESSIALIMLDLDHFKLVNDTWGHQAGDRVLVTLARILVAAVRREDMPARVGGEEFAIIMPDVPGDEALQAAERLRALVAASLFDIGVETVEIRISIGVASTDMQDVRDAATLVRLADEALYRAKQRGRDRVEAAWLP